MMDVFPSTELALHPGVTLAVFYANGRWRTMGYTGLVENRRRDWVETFSVPDSEWSRTLLDTGIMSLIIQGGQWTWGTKGIGQSGGWITFCLSFFGPFHFLFLLIPILMLIFI
ncbi:uncharacterized protein BO80DRAFT_143529 [Aspergillus ibericus CBS 121593]|uniref:Uncharacterized protein n=1 Tax=Aspergillus ibericus CBS 121593 TaxID=1448316 RepID=A0A395GTY6_9EURO|nr:hypothetical protein BO80DRAFT_143529 [Aspergillus ibericus CBS 121593]RAK99040.1 hypothetical protein BO80DRAFT_143529 [Aspergillus ibericus CBS 121593]